MGEMLAHRLTLSPQLVRCPVADVTTARINASAGGGSTWVELGTVLALAMADLDEINEHRINGENIDKDMVIIGHKCR